MRCSKCATENALGKRFCSQCGSGLAGLCPKCSAENSATSRYCGDCGAELIDAVRADTAQAGSGIRVKVEQPDLASSLDGERKTVTALFADIKGSMDLIEDIDPEEARAIVDPAIKLMIGAAHRYDGYIVQSTGDGSSRPSARPSRARIIRSALCTRRSACRKTSSATPRSCARKRASICKSASA
jgi:hypothetical protein